ncbi:MAG: NrfD/PsrC family molybdoenzyme membrane anchor subunit [Chloroflexota bacterium]
MAEHASRQESVNPDGQASARGYYGLPVLKAPVWRWEVWSYFFLGGLAAGSFVVASLARIFGDKRDRLVSRVGYRISFAAVAFCPPLLIRDLGRPGRFLNMLRVLKPESPMSVGVWGLVGFSGCAALAALGDAFAGQRGARGVVARLIPARGIAAVGTVLAILLGGYTGVLLSVTSVPLWSRGRLLGPAFLASALASGLSAITLALSIGTSASESSIQTLDRLKLVTIAAEAATLAGFVGSSDRAARPLLDPQQYGRPFIAGALGLGLVIPALAILTPSARGRGSSLLASLCGLLGGVLLRYAVVEAGRASAEDPEATFWHTDLPEGKA